MTTPHLAFMVLINLIWGFALVAGKGSLEHFPPFLFMALRFGIVALVLLPVLLKNILVGTLGWPTDLAAHLELMIVGGLIILFLIAEPHGLAQLWRIGKEKLRLWPFPH